jgi:hypothetical protein
VWVDRRFFESLLADRAELHELRGAKAALEQQVTTQKGQLDNVITILNLSNTDRSLLLQRVLDVGIPVATFARADEPRDASPTIPRPDFSGLPDRSMPAPSAEAGETLLADVFGDMGDDAAKKEGLIHAPTGEVVDAGTRN